ncbi:MAG: ABC transporter permease [Candidatus Omnitrophota bacterium]|jgi:phospholipid/cholesterol/gamma-HCH transport system permease protein|nr:MAG: ABC transporter permease [Candidatus Omnitrophota bacterium]
MKPAGPNIIIQETETFLYRIGRRTVDFLEIAGRLAQLFLETVSMCFQRPFRLRLIVEQMVSIGVMSIPIALLTATFTGMVLVLQTGVQLKPLGMKIYSSGISAISFAREIGPVLTSVVLAGRVAAGIAAEIGTMKVTEQIDALKTLGTNPVSYLVVPRFIAATFMFPMLTILAIAMGIGGGFIVGVFLLNITPGLYITNIWKWLALNDYLGGVFKTFFFGMIVAIVGCHKGFETGFGAQGVGEATTQSVVMASILILIANFFLTSWIIQLLP